MDSESVCVFVYMCACIHEHACVCVCLCMHACVCMRACGNIDKWSGLFIKMLLTLKTLENCSSLPSC